jgi:hypothetical protein
MRFNFSNEAKRANEMSVGISYREQERIPMDALSSKVKPSVCESNRRVTPRGSVYLQMNRKASLTSIKEVIARF